MSLLNATSTSSELPERFRSHPGDLKRQSESHVGDDDTTEKLAKLSDGFRAFELGDDVDTLELGLLANECQGPYECGFTFEAAKNGTLKGYKNCKKNPTHEGFLPINEFLSSGTNCLPDGYKHQLIFDFIKCHAALTVRLQIRYISKGRPLTHPRTGEEYLFGQMNDKIRSKLIMHGTGTVVDAKKVNEDWYALTIATARHVVFDQSETDKTTIEFTAFCDDPAKESSISDGKHKIITSDACLISVQTRDTDLGQIMERNLLEFRKKRIDALQLFNAHEGQTFLPIVSHPHGYEKQVSFGFIQGEIRHKYEDIPKCLSAAHGLLEKLNVAGSFSPHGVRYDTSTCQGSSGAFIFHKDNLFRFVTCSIHEGGVLLQKGRNFSGDNTNLEEHLREDSDLAAKEEVCRALRQLVVDAKNQEGDAQAMSDDENMLQQLKNLLKDKTMLENIRQLFLQAEIPMAGWNVEVKREIDDERSYEFRRRFEKALKLFPPGTVALVADCVMSCAMEALFNKDLILERFRGVRHLRSIFGKNMERIDIMTGGAGDESLVPDLKGQEAVNFLISEARQFQDVALQFLQVMTPTKEVPLKKLKAIITDPSNEKHLNKVFRADRGLPDADGSVDTKEFDEWFEAEWESDPSRLRRIYATINQFSLTVQ